MLTDVGIMAKLVAMTASDPDFDQIKERFEELLRMEKWAEAVSCAGVDNWEGYSYAMEMMDDEG